MSPRRAAVPLALLLHLGQDKSAVNVEAAMRKAIATLPVELRRSVTWDQGAEMVSHATFTTDATTTSGNSKRSATESPSTPSRSELSRGTHG